MLDATRNRTIKLSEVSVEAVKKLQNDYYVEISDFEPAVY